MMEYRDPRKLKDHPLNDAIYSDGVDREFVESCAGGIIQPIVVTPDDLIISGHRRKLAAIHNRQVQVPVTVRFDLTDPLDVEEAVILANRQREKTREQKAREAKRLREIERERAQKRQRDALKAGPAPVCEPVPTREKPEKKRDSGAKGRASDIAGQAVGWSGKTVDRAAEVVETIDRAEESGDKTTAASLRETLNTRGVAPAHQQAAKFSVQPRPRLPTARPSNDGPIENLCTRLRSVAAQARTLAQTEAGKHIELPKMERHFESLERLFRNTKKRNDERFRAEEVALPPSLDTPEFRAAWREWCLHRRKTSKSISEQAARMQLNKLAEVGPERGVEALRLSIQNDWQGVFPERVGANGGRTNGHRPERTQYVPGSEYVEHF